MLGSICRHVHLCLLWECESHISKAKNGKYLLEFITNLFIFGKFCFNFAFTVTMRCMRAWEDQQIRNKVKKWWLKHYDPLWKVNWFIIPIYFKYIISKKGRRRFEIPVLYPYLEKCWVWQELNSLESDIWLYMKLCFCAQMLAVIAKTNPTFNALLYTFGNEFYRGGVWHFLTGQKIVDPVLKKSKWKETLMRGRQMQ